MTFSLIFVMTFDFAAGKIISDVRNEIYLHKKMSRKKKKKEFLAHVK